MEQPHLLSIVIPSYNEETYIVQTLEKVCAAHVFGLQKEIIIVDDASSDKTQQRIRSFIQSHRDDSTSIVFIEQPKNQGKGASLKKGFLKSQGDIVIVQDADTEYDPDNYPMLLTPLLHGKADVVYGTRFNSAQPHRVLYFWHYVANLTLTTISNVLTNLNLSDMETGYKAFQGNLIRSLAPQLTSKKFGFEPEITARIAKIPGVRIFEVGVSYWGRTYEEGKKITWKDGIRALWEIVYYNLFVK
jgi:glycosyltransferase involved in cell wall biosynthesis